MANGTANLPGERTRHEPADEDNRKRAEEAAPECEGDRQPGAVLGDLGALLQERRLSLIGVVDRRPDLVHQGLALAVGDEFGGGIESLASSRVDDVLKYRELRIDDRRQ